MDPGRVTELLEHAVSASLAAGDLIMSRYRAAGEVWDKSPGNPVTLADLEADRLLCERLTAVSPDCGWLSEETAGSPDRLDKPCCWVVDPLDGTEEFVQGLDQFAVSVALVEEGQPLLGVVHNPATSETFATAASSLSCRGAGQGVAYNDEPANPLSDRGEVRGARMLVSGTEVELGMWAAHEHLFDLDQVGSAAYKLARLAAGLGDVYVSLKPKHEWDICAGVALVLAAGGRVTDLTGRPIQFNRAMARVNGVAAANAALHAALIDLLQGG